MMTNKTKTDEIIKEKLKKTVIPKTDFDRPIAAVVGKLFDSYIIPWIRTRFEKYTEEQFHERMVDGFDFLQDLKVNHPDKYKLCVLSIRPIRNRIIIQKNAIYGGILEIFAQYGWTVTDKEQDILMKDVTELVHELYTR
jgi:hypothetical protein